jgi:uncharacterized damage-inducible protein DinB
MKDEKVTNEFLRESVHRIELNYPRISKCLDLLNEDEVWKSPNTSSNSVGNLVLHLCGNITQYIISGLGGEKDERDREFEFSANGSHSKNELDEKIRTVTARAVLITANLTAEDLLKLRILQGNSISGLAAVIHVTEHYSYHTGQIVLLTKLMKDADMGFYSGLDLSLKNEN